MFDQSFSVANFRKIYDSDRHNKGSIEIKCFPIAYRIQKKIKILRYLLKSFYHKNKSKTISKLYYEQRKEKINKHIEIREEQYNQEVNGKLQIIVNKVNKKGYSLPLIRLDYKIKDKDVFSLVKCNESFFVSKHIQNILCSLYKIKMNHRDLIISRLSIFTNDKSPKYIIRADIEKFYESIKHENLLDIIHSSPKLSVMPKRIITQLLRKYQDLTGNEMGLPRGVGISSFLSEIYMKKVDDNICSLKDVTYYERYVDDLIVIFSPTSTEKIKNYFPQINNIILDVDLKLNDKTKTLDLSSEKKSGNFEYLGYKFTLNNNQCEIKLSYKKCNKIKSRIKKSFHHYNNNYKKNPNKSYKHLLSRIKFITGNTRLYNSKSNAFVGVYFSNKYITDSSDLRSLDHYLQNEINKIDNKKIIGRLSKFSFEKGFQEKIFRNFSIKELINISKAWKND